MPICLLTLFQNYWNLLKTMPEFFGPHAIGEWRISLFKWKNSGYVKNKTYYQRRNISVCMCGKGAHLWQHWKFSAIQRKQNTIEEITVYTGTVALLRPFQALILIGSHTGKAVKCLLKICAIEFSLWQFSLQLFAGFLFSDQKMMRLSPASIFGGVSMVALVFGAAEAVNRLTAACKNFIASRPIHEVAFVMSDALPCCRHAESRETVRKCRNPHCKAKLSHKIIEHIDSAKHLICIAM